jgi:crotonobetainyl-CoA:carnitine CoA-transferase CaiB-like acyl-CoA transferase
MTPVHDATSSTTSPDLLFPLRAGLTRPMACALDSVTVIDLSSGAAAALATMFLCDQGARVIRVIPPGTSHLREGGFLVWDRGKACVNLDLDAALEAVDAASITGTPAADLLRLVAGADVLVEDFAPASPLQRLVEWERLKRHNPRLVGCSITAYGKRGPWRDEPPIDDLVLARTGLLAGMPGFRPAPVHVVHPLPTVGAGLFAAIGIGAALLAREATGRGRLVETSLMAGALLYQTKVSGERLDRQVFQTHPSGSAPFYSVYPCADGQWVQLGCVHIGFIAAAAQLLGIAELIAEPRFHIGRGGASPQDDAELRATLTRILKTRPLAEWAAAFEAADVPFAPARLTEDGLSDPQVLHNGMLTTLSDPAVGELLQMGVPIRLTATPGRVAGPRASAPLEARDLPLQVRGREGASPAGDVAARQPPPLAGVRVLEITNLIAGPTAGRILADLGADVIKLEPPGGDMSRPIARAYFYAVNFNKRSICVDGQTDVGKQIIRQIAASADALVANLRPHATERMGIGPAVNPRLIETHLTGYGWTGPYAKRPGIDPLAQALLGLERAQGGPDNPPVFPAQLAPTDYTAGAMGALGTILALLARARSGIVQRVECDLLSGGIVLSSPWFTRYAQRPERPLADKQQYGLGPFHRLYAVRDGWIYVVAERDEARQAVCAIFGVPAPDVSAPPQMQGRHPNTTPFAVELATRIGRHSQVDALAALRAAGVPCSEVRPPDSEAFLDDPNTIANHMVAVRQHPSAGKLRVAWQLVQFADTRAAEGPPTPLLGQHTNEVLREIGYREGDIRSFYAAGVVKTEAA